jgi:hypothetical protein
MADKAVEHRHDDLGNVAPPEREGGAAADKPPQDKNSSELEIPGKPMSDMAPAGQDGAEETP